MFAFGLWTEFRQKFVSLSILKSQAKAQTGVAQIELAIVMAFLVIGFLPLLLNFILPHYMAATDHEKMLVGFSSSSSASHQLQRLSLEGFQIEEQPSQMASIISTSLAQMEGVSETGGYCAVVLYADQGSVSIGESYDRNGSECEDASSNPLPALALQNFQSSLDPYQTGTEVGLVVFKKDDFSRMRTTTAIANNQS